jgi:hypothetical protein
MLRNSFARVALVLCVLLSLSPSGAAGEELPRGRTGALHSLLALLPEAVRSWLDERPESPAPAPSARALKCSGGIDPNGKPCP